MNMSPRPSMDDIADTGKGNAIILCQFGECDRARCVSAADFSDGMFIEFGVSVFFAALGKTWVKVERMFMTGWPAFGVQPPRMVITARDTLGLRMRTVAFAIRHSPLTRGVLEVISTGAEKEVCGIDAVTNVAFVTNHQPVRDRAVVKFPRPAMGGDSLPFGRRELPVATLSQAGSPQPAIAGCVHMRPEPNLGRKVSHLAGDGARHQFGPLWRPVERRTAVNARRVWGKIQGLHDDLLAGRCDVLPGAVRAVPRHFVSPQVYQISHGYGQFCPFTVAV